MPRRKFTREFKISAVKHVNEQDYSIVDAAKSLGVDPNCVRGWERGVCSEPTLPSGRCDVSIARHNLRQIGVTRFELATSWSRS
jgi:hypothetical protein